MARVVILGGGVAGHTAATFAKEWLGEEHEVVVVTPDGNWNWTPSNIWVGTGEMRKEDAVFPIAPVYEKVGIDYREAKAVSIHPEGKSDSDKAFVTIEYTGQGKAGQSEELSYDYLVNATGAKLDFDATPGLGNGNAEPGPHTVSVCTAEQALHASEELEKVMEKMRKGQKQTILIGMGHGMCTYQGAVFEYIFSIEHKLREEGIREYAEIIYISNESFLGDFGMGGMHIKMGGYAGSSKLFTESLYNERDIKWILGAHVTKVEEGRVTYKTLDGDTHEQEFDFAMLIPLFAGVGIKAYDKEGNDMTDKLFTPNGFMKVDADYTPKPYEEWKASDWPSTLQNPDYKNIFAAGIAFAPPHSISKPVQAPDGTPITPAAPRTGMPNAMMGKAVAASIRDMILEGASEPTHTANMSEMGATFVTSAVKDFFTGTAVAMTIYPIVPDYEKYPDTGRDINITTAEIGLAAHWTKHIQYHIFMYKAKLLPGWTLIT